MSTADLQDIYRTIARYINKFRTLLETKPLYKKVITGLILTGIAALGVYIRAIPALKWGLELHGNDPWIAYWETKYVYEHGLLSWWSLTRDNPATQAFWYPNGRDFTTTDYPGIALWTALTYPIAQAFGLTLKEWLALQPLIFAALTVLTIFLAVKEIMKDSYIAGLIGALLYAIIPAASDRTIVGFVEKEGIALAFVFLFLYFYAKVMKERDRRRKIYYTVFTALSLSAIGWFWGGYSFFLASIPLATTLYPILAGKQFDIDIVKYNFILVILSLVFVSPVGTTMKVLGFSPFKISFGVLILGLFALPLLYWYLGIKKKIIGRGIYFIILVALAIAGLALIVTGVISIGARYAYALGLRPFLKLGPLVESIEEHQPAIDPSHPSTFIRVLYTWGWTGFFLSIIGALYLLYKARPETLYVSIAFLIAFYAYINATYFEAVASSLGIVTTASFLSMLIFRIIPAKKPGISSKKKRGRKKRVATVTIYRRSRASVWIPTIILLLLFIPIIHADMLLVDTHEHMIPSIMAAGTSVSDRNNAWYDLIKFIDNNLSKDALIVAWWDYGYWVTVLTGRRTLADGATLNGTQIMLLGKILTAFNETEALEILKRLHAPENATYILTFDVFYFLPTTDKKVLVVPYISNHPYPQYPTIDSAGLVDTRKSVWMIRIGRRNLSDYLYIFNNQNGVSRLFNRINTAKYYISPLFGTPWDLPVLYRMMVEGILYLNIEQPIDKYKGYEYEFVWFNGTKSPYIPDEVRRAAESLGITYTVDVLPTLAEISMKHYNKTAMTHIKPYYILARPFEHNPYLYVVIFLFKVDFSG